MDFTRSTYICIFACKFVCMCLCVCVYVCIYLCTMYVCMYACIICKYLRVPAYLHLWNVWQQIGKGGMNVLKMVSIGCRQNFRAESEQQPLLVKGRKVLYVKENAKFYSVYIGQLQTKSTAYNFQTKYDNQFAANDSVVEIFSLKHVFLNKILLHLQHF